MQRKWLIYHMIRLQGELSILNQKLSDMEAAQSTERRFNILLAIIIIVVILLGGG
jgi:hypothetical protein